MSQCEQAGQPAEGNADFTEEGRRHLAATGCWWRGSDGSVEHTAAKERAEERADAKEDGIDEGSDGKEDSRMHELEKVLIREVGLAYRSLFGPGTD